MILSIITIALTNDEHLSNTVNSIRKQKNKNNGIMIEHLIVSPDQSCEEFYEEIFCFRAANGIYDAMNFGLLKSSGDLVWFLNSGDVSINLDFLIQKIKYNHNSSIDIYGFSVILGDINGKLMHPRITSPHPGTIYKRDIFNTLKGFDQNLMITADRDLLDRARESGFKIEWCNVPIAVFDLNGISSKKRIISCRYRDAVYEIKNRPINMIRIWRFLRYLF